MMKPIPPCCAALALSLAATLPPLTPALGAEAFEGQLPIELARYFVGGGTMLRGLPDDFPAFDPPDGLELLGTLDTGNRRQVFFRSNLDDAAAQEALAQAFLAQGGWLRLTSPAEIRPRQGFIVPEQEARQAGILGSVTLCHDELGRLHIQARYLDDVVSLGHNVSVRRPRLGPSCAQENEMLNQLARPAGLERFLPALEVPTGTQEARRRIYTDSFGRDPSAAVERVIQLSGLELPPEELERHFAEQLEAQDWRQDANWTGEVSAGSNWLLAPDDGPELLATFQTLRIGDGVYALDFRIVTAGRGIVEGFADGPGA